MKSSNSEIVFAGAYIKEITQNFSSVEGKITDPAYPISCMQLFGIFRKNKSCEKDEILAAGHSLENREKRIV